MPLSPMSTPGAVKRPKLQYPDKTGTLRDWNGLISAQGCVVTDRGVQTTSAYGYWNANFSAVVITSKTEDTLTMRVWNVETQALEDHDYPASELDVGQVGNVTITDTIIDPQLHPLAAELCKHRPHLSGEI